MFNEENSSELTAIDALRHELIIELVVNDNSDVVRDADYIESIKDYFFNPQGCSKEDYPVYAQFYIEALYDYFLYNAMSVLDDVAKARWQVPVLVHGFETEKLKEYMPHPAVADAGIPTWAHSIIVFPSENKVIKIMFNRKDNSVIGALIFHEVKAEQRKFDDGDIEDKELIDYKVSKYMFLISDNSFPYIFLCLLNDILDQPHISRLEAPMVGMLNKILQ